jgi:cytosine/adenosine deaminase-related metal-dependent hydrolase
MSITAIVDATILTIDPDRRVIEGGRLLVDGDRISAVGYGDEVPIPDGATIINGRDMVAMPGLIDGHGHAGHTLLKSIGAGRPGQWQEAVHTIFAKGSSPEYWYADARLLALERLKAGVTAGISLLGGGDDMMRTNHADYGEQHVAGINDVGVRSFLAVGPGRPPFPIDYVRWQTGSSQAQSVSYDQQMQVSEQLIQSQHNKNGSRVQIAITMPVYKPWEIGDLLSLEEATTMSRDVMAMATKYGLLLTQDGHREGSLALAGDLGLLGPKSLMSHSVDLTEEDFSAVVESDTRIIHNPYAVRSILGRCPVPELMDAGVIVLLGSDAAGPDRSYDMFRHMAEAMHYHRRHFRDPNILPPGKMLEMVTIDAAHGLGMADDIGSLEIGKKADIILIDMRKPHLYPPQMPVMRLAHYATAADVDTVIVDGEILMQGRQVLSTDESAILDDARTEFDLALTRSGLGHLAEEPDSLWRSTTWDNS